MEEKTNIVVNPEEGSVVLQAAGGRGIHEFIRYVAASLLALVVDVVLLSVLVRVGVPYLYAGAVAFAVGLVIVYVLSVYWVFEKRRNGNAFSEFALFTLIGLLGLGINEGMLWAGTVYVGAPLLLSKVLSVCVVFVWNFSARKYFLFRT